MALQTDSKTERPTWSIQALWWESSYPKAIEATFVSAASDTAIDLHSRMNCYWLLSKHFRYERSPDRKMENAKLLQKIAVTLPHWSVTAREE